MISYVYFILYQLKHVYDTKKKTNNYIHIIFQIKKIQSFNFIKYFKES